MFLRKLSLYYLMIVLPLLVLAGFTGTDLIDSTTFVIVLMIYSLIYHPVVSGLRLLALKKIKPPMFWACLVPGITMLFFRDLYFPSKLMTND